VPGVVVSGAAAGGLATAAGHDDEAAVQEPLGLVEELVEFAAALSLGGGQQRRGNGLAWHGLRGSERTDIRKYISSQGKSWKKSNAKMLAAPPSTENRLFQPKSKDLPRLSFFHFGIAVCNRSRQANLS
jgi:hypothetical protein